MSNEPALPSPAGDGAADHALAARYAPIIRFDEREPFLPLAAGYTVCLVVIEVDTGGAAVFGNAMWCIG